MRVARRGPPGGWRNPTRGTSTGCGHSRNQRWACWHSSPTSAGCEVAKKWSLARISVYRMLLSATEGTPVKGRGSAFPGQARPLLPIDPLLPLIQVHLPLLQVCKVVSSLWASAWNVSFPSLFSCQSSHSHLSSKVTSEKKHSPVQPSSPHSPHAQALSQLQSGISLCVYSGPSHPHYPRPGVSWKQE